MENKFKIGDKVRRLERYWEDGCGITWKLKDKVLTVTDVVYESLIFKETDDHKWRSVYFELVEESFEDKIVKAYKLIGETVMYKVITTEEFKHFTIRYIKIHENSIRLYNIDDNFIHYSSVVTPPESITVELNKEYKAIVTKDTIQVGCQTFPISIIDELVKARKQFN